MKRPPLLTEDGYLLLAPQTEPTIDRKLGVPKLAATLRFEETSDTVRGVISDILAGGRPSAAAIPGAGDTGPSLACGRPSSIPGAGDTGPSLACG